MAKSKEEKLSFKEVIKQLNKQFGQVEKKERFFVTTGSPKLDKALGGGIVSGRITELIAWEGGGKTTICLHATADALKKGKKVLYIDAEHALDETYCKNLGADLEDIILFQPDFGEQAFEYAEKLLETGEIGLVIFDSTSGMIPKSQFDAEPGTTSIGKHAMLFNKEMPKINSITAKYNVVTIFISQVREKIGILFGSPETTQGGNALKFFASNRIELRKSTQEKEGDSVVGNLVKFKTLKCKTAPPFKTGDFLIEYGLGIQRWKDIMDLAIDANIIEKVGNTYSLNGVKLGIGEKQLIDTLQNKEGLLQEIEDLLLNNKAVTEKIEENDITTVSEGE